MTSQIPSRQANKETSKQGNSSFPYHYSTTPLKSYNKKKGKKICETLKAIRRDIAVANEIDYQPAECHHEGDCAGTCPKCESETRWLERQLRNRQALGKMVTIAGLSLALGALSSCHKHHKYNLDDSESSDISCSHETCTSYEDVDGYLDDSDSCFTPLVSGEKNAYLDDEGDDDEDDREVVMGEVAVDENGNTYGP